MVAAVVSQPLTQTFSRHTAEESGSRGDVESPLSLGAFSLDARVRIRLQDDSRIRTICMSRLGLICWVGIENHNLERQHQSLSGLAFRAGSANTNSGRQQN